VVKPGLAAVTRTWLAAWLAVVAVLFCRTAEACPACTTRSSGSFLTPLLLGGMILTPYLVTTVVLRIVRRGEAERRLEEAALARAAASANGGRSHHEAAPAGGVPARI